ncbi:MAG TPA: IPTL-CTERM sorting domain-containing protein, partial [Burkholderiaceae bacterium]
HVLGDPAFAVSATGGASGNPVVFSSQTMGVCQTSGTNGSTVTLLAAGTCTLRASQAGDDAFGAATPVDRSFTVAAPTPAGTQLPGSGGTSGGVSGGTWQFAANSQGFVAAAGYPDLPSGYSFPHGLFSFVLTGGAAGTAATVSIAYPSALPAGTVFWKYGSTADTPAAHWYQIPATFAPDRKSVSFSVTDGGLGDDDLAANGLIVDPVGAGIPPGSGVTSVPTLSQWGHLLLALAMGTMAVMLTRRRLA